MCVIADSLLASELSCDFCGLAERREHCLSFNNVTTTRLLNITKNALGA